MSVFAVEDAESGLSTVAALICITNLRKSWTRATAFVRSISNRTSLWLHQEIGWLSMQFL